MAEQNPNLENELGTTGGLAPAPWSPFSNAPSGYVVDPLETNPDLRFPWSAPVFDEMRRTDAQISANLRAMTQPILNAQWDLVPADDVRPEVVEFIRGEIGLVPKNDARSRRRRQGIVFRDHLRDALMCLPFGFAVLEQVYEYSRADGRLHIRKLAPRPVTTITKIHVGKDGGLVGISQTPPPAPTFGVQRLSEVFIPVEKLVWYTLDKEGSDWTGMSVLRPGYKNWMMKSRLERLEAQALERNGMGLPVAWASGNLSNEDRARLDAAMAGVRAGARSYAVFPSGVEFDIKGVSGSTKDFGPTISRHDQQISKSMMAMFMDLGHDAGARSLGDTFFDAFLVSCQGVADKIAEDFTEHVIRDLVELNFGPDEPYPALVPGDLKSNQDVAVDTLKTLADAGLITPDAKLEAHVRSRYGLPEADPATAAPKPVAVPPVAAEAVTPDGGLAFGEHGHRDLTEHIELARLLKDLRDGQH